MDRSLPCRVLRVFIDTVKWQLIFEKFLSFIRLIKHNTPVISSKHNQLDLKSEEKQSCISSYTTHIVAVSLLHLLIVCCGLSVY